MSNTDFQQADYGAFVARFPGFSSKNPDTEAQYISAVNQVILSCKREIAPDVWGDLALEGLFNLVACKLSQQTMAQIMLNAAQVELEILNQELANSTNTETINLSQAQRITVEDEYSIELNSSSSSSNSSSRGGLVKNLTSQRDNYFCQEYQRLQDLVGDSMIYSFE